MQETAHDSFGQPEDRYYASSHAKGS
jgi:hypothetical protein